jgi:signal transduction histidine kinase
MFLWIRDQQWLPTSILALACLLIFGGIDFLIQGVEAIPAAILLAASVALSRALPYVSIALFSIAIFLPIFLGIENQISQISISISLLILAAFASTTARWIGFSLNIILGSITYFWLIFTLPEEGTFYGLPLPSDESKAVLAIAGFVALIAVNANAWFIGRLLYTRITHVGTDFDQAVMTHQVVSSQLALAEQDRRFGIARDVNDILLEQVGATMASAEAGIYASKSDPSIAPRLLESLLVGVKKSYAEIRRLSDLLGLQKEKALALPGLRDLNELLVSYREYGYRITFREQGDAIKLVAGADLIVYRIVFESLDNIRKHTPIGTEVDVDFMWQGNAMQVVIKDNGEETQRALEQDINGYSTQEDQKALVERPVGAGLTAMQERASLYQGTMDFVRVPGVGFTVSAAFPNIAIHAEGK